MLRAQACPMNARSGFMVRWITFDGHKHFSKVASDGFCDQIKAYP